MRSFSRGLSADWIGVNYRKRKEREDNVKGF